MSDDVRERDVESTEDIEELRDELACVDAELAAANEHCAALEQTVLEHGKRADIAEAKWSAAQAEIVKLLNTNPTDVDAATLLVDLRKVIE